MQPISAELAQISEPTQSALSRRHRPSVGIVGGGVAGLYAAILLRRKGHRVHIFEASNRVGGRIYTHHFSSERNQYFEAGAMRIPQSKFQQILFDLIQYLNSYPGLPKDKQIDLIDYILNSEGNLLHVNGDSRDGQDVNNVTPADINWDVPDEYRHKTAGSLLQGVLDPLVKPLLDDFDTGFAKLLTLDDFPFRFYLKSIAQWPDSVVDFVETICSQTNQFALSVVELVMQNIDFSTKQWFTIDRGMDRLPQAMAHIIKYDNITFGARVTSIRPDKDQNDKIVITANGYNGTLRAVFDKVILAIPPASLKMLADRPLWHPQKEMAIRSMHFESLYKMGMRFKTRFWEHETPKTKGGQSTTDLPIRWIVYPSNGIDDEGPGVLLVYAWMTDSQTWLPFSPYERRSLALYCLSLVYPDSGVYDLLIETFDVAWSTRSATGDAMFLPGQFVARFEPARKPEGSIYFAGEHLSRHHTWIAGALESASYTVKQIWEDGGFNVEKGSLRLTGDDVPELPILEELHGDDELGFKFHASHPLYAPHADPWNHVKLEVKPQNLGCQAGFYPVGPEVTYLAGPQVSPAYD